MEQHPGSSAPELPLLAEMCNTGSQLAKKSRALFPALKAGLHCDFSPKKFFAEPSELFPALKAGLHCDTPARIVRNVKEYPFPSSKSWAPLRPEYQPQ